jgi:hypothetical protein
MGLRTIWRKSELGDLLIHGMAAAGTFGLANLLCDYINKRPNLSDENKKTYTDALRGAVASGNAGYYLMEHHFKTKTDYTLFLKTVFTGAFSVAGGITMALIGKYVPANYKSNSQSNHISGGGNL